MVRAPETRRSTACSLHFDTEKPPAYCPYLFTQDPGGCLCRSTGCEPVSCFPIPFQLCAICGKLDMFRKVQRHCLCDGIVFGVDASLRMFFCALFMVQHQNIFALYYIYTVLSANRAVGDFVSCFREECRDCHPMVALL
jgi:hypothetical protein